ncbi:MAG: T9SS type A sorting domain-containing protein [Ignavibacteriaceae bacterium]|nr:T9SS type A sorting domain-containing protein [Ignavibacteriaceae bacterium]
MTIPYTASYSALIDSFYLDVEHERSDTLVQTKKYALSKNNPSHVTLYLEGLLLGDKIKLRVRITDTSIFFNVAHYPDTGWVVMSVLPPILNVEDGNLPIDYGLSQNYPNPFNPITSIQYQLPEPAFVTIKVYDVLGNEIETLVNEERDAGSYKIDFNGLELTSGIYYYRIAADNFSQTKKMILLK